MGFSVRFRKQTQAEVLEIFRFTLQALLSGTFLQTLQDLITPLKGHSLFFAQLSTDLVSALRKVWVLNKFQALLYDILPLRKVPESDARSMGSNHTPSIALWHLPPNSAGFGYATERALFISAQLSTDAVSALRKVRVLI